MIRLLPVVLPTLIILGTSHFARADPESCREALDQYHSAKNEVFRGTTGVHDMRRN
jgi:hypothetical protein